MKARIIREPRCALLWRIDESYPNYAAIERAAKRYEVKLRRVADGDLGGIVATLGVVFPSLVIIIILAHAITSVSHLGWVKNAFAGIRACVAVQIINAVVKLGRKSVVDKRTLAIFVLVFCAGVLTDISPVWFVVLAAAAGVLLKQWEAHQSC